MTGLVSILEENLFHTKDYNLRRRMKRIIDSLKLLCRNNDTMLHSWTTLTSVFCFFIMVKVLTLNSRSIKGEEKQIQLALHAKQQKTHILLLKETYLSDIAVLPGLTLYNIIQNPAIQVCYTLRITTPRINSLTPHPRNGLLADMYHTKFQLICR
jgi:hypothetical protein